MDEQKILQLKQRTRRFLHSWFTSVNVPVQLQTGGEFDIIIQNAEGRFIGICAVEEFPNEIPNDSVIYIKLDSFRTRDGRIEAFREVEKLLGYENLIPVDRGETPDHKLNAEKDFELVSMRHQEFREAPNPPPEKLKAYRHTIKSACEHVYYKNRYLLDRHGYEICDLETWGFVFTTAFIHHYELLGEDREVENQKLLYRHIVQRFYYFLEQLRKQDKKQLPDDASLYAYMADPSKMTNMGPVDDPTMEDEEPDEEWKERNVLITAHGKDARRNNASYVLTNLLNEMPHDDMVQALKNAQENEIFDSAVKREAKKRLKKHEKNCEICSSLHVENEVSDIKRAS